MYTELELEFYKAETRHEEKFGEPPYFTGIINPSADGEEYISLIEEAIRKNKPLNQEKEVPPYLRTGKVIY